MKKFMATYWKTLLSLAVVMVGMYAIGATLEGNMEWQAAQAKQARERPLTAVATVAATIKAVERQLSATGVLAPVETLELLSETDGRVVEMRVELNQLVRQGQVLAQTDPRIKQIELSKAELQYQKAKRDFERLQPLFQRQNLSEYDLETARFQMEAAEQEVHLAQQVLEFCTIKSPISGFVSQKMIGLGKVLQPGSPVVQIVDISRLRLWVHVAATDLGDLKIGQSVRVVVPARPGETFAGTVRSMAVQSTEAGTFPVEIILPNPTQPLLLAGMHAEAHFEIAALQEVLVIPRLALLGNRVFVLENGKAMARNIVIGQELGQEVAVLDGLRPGEQVVVKGQQQLEDGQVVQQQTNN